MKKDKREKIYNKIYSQFIDLENGLIDKAIVLPNEMLELGFIAPHNEVICDNNGNYVCDYIDGRYYNYADILKKHFGDKLIQEVDIATGNYIFRKSGVNRV